MQKQISYPKLVSRLFAITLDFALLTPVSWPIANFVNKKLIVWQYKDFLISEGVNLNNGSEIVQALSVVAVQDPLRLFGVIIQTNIAPLIVAALYFICFWYYLGCTPGKYFIKMRIVDEKTHKKPKLSQLIIRFCGYALALVGIWFIAFDKRNRALHDRISGTIVIKS